jgi:hypothetical protein
MVDKVVLTWSPTPNPPSSSIDSIAVTNSSGCSIELDHEGFARDTPAEIPDASGSLDILQLKFFKILINSKIGLEQFSDFSI